MKKFLKVVIVLLVLGAAGYFGWQYYQQNDALPAGVPAVSQNAYSEYTIARGNLSKSVTGTGTLSIARTADIALPYAVTVTGTLVGEGDNVTAGQALMTVDAAALQTAIDTLQTELDTTESDIASLADDYVRAEYIKLPMDCRVKEVGSLLHSLRCFPTYLCQELQTDSLLQLPAVALRKIRNYHNRNDK